MKYYFLGIGGIGMSALARFFHQRGDQVSGYDRTPSPLTAELEAEGIAVHYDDDPSRVPQDADLAIFTPAVPRTTAVFQRCEALGLPMEKRSQMLGHLTEGKRCVAVAGSHGKTTTSSMIAHLLAQSHVGCSAFLGGIAKNFGSNLVVNNESPWVVVEADEYDRSFLQLHPEISIVTATDPDHLDIYGSHEKMLEAYQQFVDQTSRALIMKEKLPLHSPLSTLHSYSAQSVDADYYAVNIRQSRGNLYFDLRTPEKVLYDLQLTHQPLYNVENAVAACAAALLCGVSEQELRQGLRSYEGVRRRFDYQIDRRELVFIDDYAHHPQELEAVIASVRYLYPGKRIVGIFQPHLYSRTRDLCDGFARALEALDEVVLLPIYPARELPIPGVSSAMIVHKINSLSKYYVTKEQLFTLLPALYPDVILTLGAGDIDRLVPQIKQKYEE